eukprot:TRINITY_DN1970_c0_g1_i2.p1 TRINITY_DN1970_c0_g1~~TRINITY_DN1970_c0_g1_i2.p1  ORF type:complete len:233 (-),score=79.54 TRINITY_DN1970_c0_g1_i2:49-747(-)
MMLHWQVVLLTLFAEVAAIAIFLVPNVPVFLKKQIIGLATNPVVQRVIKVYLAVVSVLCLESLYENATTREPAEVSDHEAFHHYEADLLKNRLNAIISGSSILLFFILNEVCDLVKNNLRMISNTEVLKKQGENATKEYMKLVKQDKSDSKTESKEGTEDSDKLKQTNKELSDENKNLKEQVKKLKQEVEAIKTQATNQQESFSKLLDENKSLKNKLEDFNDVFGEAQKKKV